VRSSSVFMYEALECLGGGPGGAWISSGMWRARRGSWGFAEHRTAMWIAGVLQDPAIRQHQGTTGRRFASPASLTLPVRQMPWQVAWTRDRRVPVGGPFHQAMALCWLLLGRSIFEKALLAVGTAGLNQRLLDPQECIHKTVARPGNDCVQGLGGQATPMPMAGPESARSGFLVGFARRSSGAVPGTTGTYRHRRRRARGRPAYRPRPEHSEAESLRP